MSDTLLLILSMSACLAGSIVRKLYTGKTAGALRWLYIFNIVCSLLPCGILLVWGGIGSVSLFTAALGCLFGLVTVAQTVFNLKALEAGPMSYTTVICSFSTVISALSGAMFFGETLNATHIIGMVLMAGSFLLAVEKKAGQKSTGVRWLAYCIITFVCTGSIGIMQKVHQSSVYKDELNAFLIVAFGVSALATLPLLFTAPKGEKSFRGKERLLLVGCLLLSGVSVALNNKWNLYLSGVMDSAVFFPIVNGGGLIMITVLSLVFFKERLTKRQWMGMALGAAATLLLCL